MDTSARAQSVTLEFIVKVSFYCTDMNRKYVLKRISLTLYTIY